MSNFRSLLLLSILTSKSLPPQVSLDLSELDEIASLWSIGKIQLNGREQELLEQLLTEFAEELLEPGQKVTFGSFRFTKAKDGTLSINQVRPNPSQVACQKKLR